MPAEITSRQIHERRPAEHTAAADSNDGTSLTSVRLHVACVVLALLAAYIFTLTEHDNHEHTFWCVFEILMQTILVIVATVYFRMRLRLLHESSVLMPMLLMIACLSLICEPIQRLFFNNGHSFEMLVMHSQCNLMLALAVCGFRITFQRLAVIIAVFMTIFCCTISSARGLVPLTILFILASMTWLVVSWWDTVDRRLLRTDQSRTPKWGLIATALLPLIALLGAGAFGSNTVTTALKGFMPSSGGTGQYDPFSRGGVSDGDALIAGNENIKSFAALEDAPFLDSDKPSLYDVFNDTFDEPPRKIRKQERAIALSADLMKHIHQMMAEAKQAGREFSLLRSEKESDRSRIRDLDTHALFYVAGRTPVHLKTEVYEYFNGVEWAPSIGEVVESVQLKESEGRHWLQTPQNGRGFEIFDGTVTHSLKSANLGGNVIPSPAHAVGINIDLVDRADMYCVRNNGLISLERESIPSMTPINFVSRCVDRSALAECFSIGVIRRSAVADVRDLRFYVPSGDDMDRIRQLTQRITASLPRGWQQFQAIEDHLRNNYQLDRSHRIAADVESPLTEFLFEDQRGPEYLFASSAAIMLRTLGYSTRLIGGFYARPDRYDEQKQHTAVLAKDAHLWCEVCIGADCWMTIEPSPGYDIIQPPPNLLTRIWNAMQMMAAFATRNALFLMAISLTAAALFIYRRSLQECLLTLRWRMLSKVAVQSRTVRLANLIDHRLRLAGLGRKTGTTLRRWSQQAELRPVRKELSRLAEIADRAVYADDENSAFDTAELDRLARRLNFRELTRLKKESVRTQNNPQAV